MIAESEMPKYRCHKTVWALKIADIEFDKDNRAPNEETDGTAMIRPVETRYAPFKVDADYVRRHNPQIGGYYVVYADGYKSWSPAEVFEDGYTLIK